MPEPPPPPPNQQQAEEQKGTSSSKRKKPQVLSPLAQIREIENDPLVRKLIDENLPSNYDFEIGKTIWRIRKNEASTVALQFPEGLLIFSTKIGSILTELTGVDVILMGDITYGACCVDDFTASMLGADLLVHYGHSCLVPVAVANKIDTIYVFVTIKFNLEVAAQSICKVIEEEVVEEEARMRPLASKRRVEYEEEGSGGGVEKVNNGSSSISNSSSSPFRVWLVSTIQFANSLGELKKMIEEVKEKRIVVSIPRSKPLSNGEILGCTAPKIDGDLIVYVGDGRFHLEAMMMANPGVTAYRYDPYNTTMTLESFDHKALSIARSKSIDQLIIKTNKSVKKIGIILGTLGRQGNPQPMDHVYGLLASRGYDPFVLLMSEVMPAKLKLFDEEGVSGFVQFACPRLSIDWGEAFHVPVLTSFEATLLLLGRGGDTRRCDGGGGCCCSSGNTGACYSHPMDYYAYDSCGAHTPNHKKDLKIK